MLFELEEVTNNPTFLFHAITNSHAKYIYSLLIFKSIPVNRQDKYRSIRCDQIYLKDYLQKSPPCEILATHQKRKFTLLCMRDKSCGLPAVQYISARWVVIQHPVTNEYVAVYCLKENKFGKHGQNTLKKVRKLIRMNRYQLPCLPVKVTDYPNFNYSTITASMQVHI